MEGKTIRNLTKFNTKLALRWNFLFRKLFINRHNRKRLQNRDFTLLCNNCNGGVITHDLGLQFRSPTVNMFFYGDHFFKFCERLEYYLEQELTLCREPIHKPDCEYPVCNLGDLELHFLHYKDFAEAKETWTRRCQRINRENLFIMWTFFGGTDREQLARFDRLPFENKVAFTEKEFPEYKSAFCIHGHEDGLGVLTLFDGLCGNRVIDQFDYVSWFDQGK